MHAHLVRKAPRIKYVSVSEPQKGCQKWPQVLGWLNQGNMDFHVKTQKSKHVGKSPRVTRLDVIIHFIYTGPVSASLEADHKMSPSRTL